MATRTLTVCDSKDHPEEVIAHETRTFPGPSGQLLKLDLCPACAPGFDELQAALAAYVAIANPAEPEAPPAPPRRTRRRSPSTAATTPPRTDNKEENALLREWAKTQPDIELGERGRIPDWVRSRFREAQQRATEQMAPIPMPPGAPVPTPPPVRPAVPTPDHMEQARAWRPAPMPGRVSDNGHPDDFDPRVVHAD